MTLNEYIDYLVNWLKDVQRETRTNGFIVGLSGGIDSALVAAIIKKASPDNSLGVIMPCHSASEDKDDALLVANSLNLNIEEIDLTTPFDYLINTVFANEKYKSNQTGYNSSYVNTKARLRMTTLYALGQALGYLVVGTDNLDEYYTGYFTKYGDGGVDLLPIIHLTKREVFEASRLLKVPEKIIRRIPSAGLYSGQTDEKELGVSYNELDDYLLGKPIDVNKQARIEQLHRISEHKRNVPLKPNPFNR